MRPIDSESRKRQRRTKGLLTYKRRRGAVLVLITLLLIPLMAMVALSIDSGYLLKIKSDMQRSADAAALACVQELVPAPDGSQDLAQVRAALRDYVVANSMQGFQVVDSDIEIGRYDPATIYSNVTILNSGIYDTVRVTLRRDGTVNSRVGLFIGPILGLQDAGVTVTATAVLQKAAILPPGADVLPFSVPQDVWDAQPTGQQWSIYGDGKMEDNLGNAIPGNWGTVDIGSTDNSTNALNDQILNGLNQSDLDALNADGRISTSAEIDASTPISLQGETGLSSGVKHSVLAIEGQYRIVPIYDSNSGAGGNNLEVGVVKWGVVKVIDSTWQGEQNTKVVIEKAYEYNGKLRAKGDLGSTSGNIEGAFTTPVLVE